MPTDLSLFDVISFAVGLMGIGFSVFAIWLSWQFYKDARDTGDKTKDAVGRIEVTVGGVNTSINEIVQQAVDHWTQSGEGADLATSSLMSVIENIQQKLADIEASKAGPTPEDLAALREKIVSIELIAEEARARASRSIFPGFSTTMRHAPEPAVKTKQFIDDAEPGFEKGTLTLSVMRPVLVVTGVGRFERNIGDSPSLKIKLVSGPPGVDPLPTANFGMGGMRGFNVHLYYSPRRPIATGDYLIEYEAQEGWSEAP